MSGVVRNRFVVMCILYEIFARCVSDNTESFKCFDNGMGRTPGFAALMPRGQMTSIPDAYGISSLQCSLLCLARNSSCLSFAYYEGLCFLRNISLAHSGVLCGISLLESYTRCPLGRIGDVFIAFAGVNRTMMECMCGVQNNLVPQWVYLSTISRYDCVDSCTSLPCTLKAGDMQKCWVCNGDYNYCLPFKDPNPTYPQRVGCMPVF